MQDSESSTSRRPPLPDTWITRIFSEMQGHYGSKFLNMWRIGQMLPDGQDAGLVNARRVWAEKLAGFADHPECIKRVLETLPAEPPTLPQFIELCRLAPRKEAPALPHRMSAEELRLNRERIAQMASQLAKSKSMGGLK